MKLKFPLHLFLPLKSSLPISREILPNVEVYIS